MYEYKQYNYFLKYSILFITQNNQGTKIFKKKTKKKHVLKFSTS